MKSYSQITQTYLQSHGLKRVMVKDQTDVYRLRFVTEKQLDALKKSGRDFKVS